MAGSAALAPRWILLRMRGRPSRNLLAVQEHRLEASLILAELVGDPELAEWGLELRHAKAAQLQTAAP